MSFVSDIWIPCILGGGPSTYEGQCLSSRIPLRHTLSLTTRGAAPWPIGMLLSCKERTGNAFCQLMVFQFLCAGLHTFSFDVILRLKFNLLQKYKSDSPCNLSREGKCSKWAQRGGLLVELKLNT